MISNGPGHLSNPVFIPSACAKCGKPAQIGVLTKEANATNESGLGLCQACAVKSIPELPRGEHITIYTLSDHASGPEIRKTYAVLRLMDQSNLVIIRPTDAGGAIIQPPVTVRYDCLPEVHRSVGALFSIRGNFVEIELFEQSAGQNLGPKPSSQ